MRVFVTGATGFVGRHAAMALAAGGHELVCLARSRERARHLEEAGHEIVEGHLLDDAALSRGAAGADAVVHVAGLIAARSGTEMRRVNVEGTARLARACHDSPPRRFVLVSSLAAGGPSLPGAPVSENRPAAPVSVYGLSKLGGERAARRGLPSETELTIVRPPAVYGPYDRGLLDLFTAAARGIRLSLGGGDVSIVHGADLAQGIRAALESSAAAGRTYYVANDESHSMDDLLARISRALGVPARVVRLPRCLLRLAGVLAEEVARLRGETPPFSRDKVREFLAPGWVCDSSRAAQDLGWRATHALDEGLAETAAWYREQSWIR